MACRWDGGWLVMQRWSRTSRYLWQIARTLVEFFSLRRLEQKKQAGGGDFALIVVAIKFGAWCKIVVEEGCR